MISVRGSRRSWLTRCPTDRLSWSESLHGRPVCFDETTVFRFLNLWSTVYTVVAGMPSSRAIDHCCPSNAYLIHSNNLGLGLGREVCASHNFYGDTVNERPDRRGCGVPRVVSSTCLRKKICILYVGYCTGKHQFIIAKDLAKVLSNDELLT
jgi:hypothetical protein